MQPGMTVKTHPEVDEPDEKRPPYPYFDADPEVDMASEIDDLLVCSRAEELMDLRCLLLLGSVL